MEKRTEKELHRVFNNCCNSDILSLLHGKLYRCPFSANATNLKAIPHDATDIVNLIDETIPLDELKIKMKKLKAFTLIEILVAMLVGSFVILLTTELISYQGKSRSQFDDGQQRLAFEIALKTLRGDINAST